MAPERYKLLAIDNDTLMRLRKLVKNHLPGFDLATASNGHDGINLAYSEYPDTILLDISIAGQDGLDTCRRLKNEDQLKNIPVICLTSAHLSSQSRLEALEAGCDVFLEKPIQAPELIAQVRAMLKIKRASDLASERIDQFDINQGGQSNLLEDPVDKNKTRLKMQQILKERGAFQDTTERKEILEALQNQIYFMESLIEALPTPIFFKDTNHIYIGCNEAYAQFIGLPKDEILGKSVHDIAPKELSDIYRAQDEKLFDNPGIQIYEHSVKSADGNLHDVIFHKSTYKDNSGEIAGLIGVMLDITALKRADRALRESEARYRQLADVTFEAILFHDKGFLLHANKQFFEMFGYTFEELHGKQLVDILFTPERAQSVKARIDSASTEAYETVGVRKDGEEFPIEVRVRIRDVDGRQIRATALRDLTQRKALERQLAHAHKMEAIGTLAGGIAHDFNNILQIILGYAEIIQESDHFSQEIETELKDIVKAASSGAELVQRLLTFSRKTEFKFLRINLNARIEQLQKMLGRIIPKMISIELDLDDDIATIMADPTQIEQILLNLAVNARDAMPEGGKFIIETRNIDLDKEYCKANIGAKPGKYVLLSVTDTGVGLDKETLEHIFEPFYTTKGVGEGTGLGLAMVYGIVKEHGGYIKCYSEPSMGTTFKIYFPAIEDHDKAQIFPEVSQIKGGQETILIVDDDEPIRAMGKKVLGKAGYNVIEASNGEEGLDMYKEKINDISLVILDLIMPKMGGVECLKKLLEMNPNLKIIIASGFSINGQGREALENGAKGFLNKPFNTTDLLSIVRETLDS